jgi:hypothetical protein
LEEPHPERGDRHPCAEAPHPHGDERSVSPEDPCLDSRAADASRSCRGRRSPVP